MTTKYLTYYLIIIGLIFSIFGCNIDQGDILLPEDITTDNAQTPPMISGQTHESEATFNHDLLPILTEKCAFAGCHVDGGPLNLDFSTYQTFIAGGINGSVFVPGDAQSSSIIDEIVSGRMPIGGPALSNAEIQLFRDWINNQQPETNVNPVPQPPQIPVPADGIVSFDQHLQPILTARCAYVGCHDANGYDGLDFRTYQAFIRGDDEGESVFIPGNAKESDIIEEIVSGRMPPDGPRLSDAAIQLFKDWINQQDPADFPNLRFDDDDDHDDDDDDD